MSLFLKDFQASMCSEVSFESESESLVHAPITPEDRDDIEELRQIAPVSSSVMEDNQAIKKVIAVLANVLENVEQLKEASPAIARPILTVVNESIQNAARTLSVTAPVQLEMDEQTETVSEASMEGVMDWISNLYKALKNALVKMRARVSISFRRIGNTSAALRKRSAKCRSLMRRRKNPDGGHSIKLHKRFLGNLINGTNVSVDPMGDLQSFTNVISDAIAIYDPLIDGILNDISSVVMQSGSLDAVYSETSIKLGAANKALLNKFNPGNLYLGNRVIRIKSTVDYIPVMEFVSGKPGVDYVLGGMSGINSLSSDECESRLKIIAELIEDNLVIQERWLDSVQLRYENLTDTIDTLIQAGTPTYSEDIDGNGSVSWLTNVNVKRLEILSHKVMSLDDLVYATLEVIGEEYFEVLSSAIALIEESILQD